MSHDQRPARIRVVGGPQQAQAAPSGASTPKRRRNDAPGTTGADAAAARALAKPRLALLPALLFLVACALGGVALPLLGLVG